jgi:hypothetical protein
VSEPTIVTVRMREEYRDRLYAHVRELAREAHKRREFALSNAEACESEGMTGMAETHRRRAAEDEKSWEVWANIAENLKFATTDNAKEG